MMITLKLRNSVNALAMVALLSLFTGCAGVDRFLPTETLSLPAAQQEQVGQAAANRLLQLLGGPYADPLLAADLAALGRAAGCRVDVADRSAAEIYPLPGRRVIVTRGLLAQIQHGAELVALITRAGRQSEALYQGHINAGLARATREFLSGNSVEYDPAAADIRLAQYFAEHPCGDCLPATSTGRSSPEVLPASLSTLKSFQGGYLALNRAAELEKSGALREAIAAYLQAATLSPDQPKILGALGLAYLRAGQAQPARLHLEQAVRLQPGYYRTQMGLGYLFLQSGQLQRANAALAESVRLLPQLENLFLLAEARQKSGDASGAESLYRFIISKDRTGKLGRSAAERLPPKGFQ